MTPAEIKTILDAHGRWLRGEADGKRADLQGANLRGANLLDANLRSADLQGAYLQGAYLQCADLQGTYIDSADLQGAYLQGANLRGAYLQDVYLQDANLRSADLRSANLDGADLRSADLQGAYLQGADLQGADLRGAKELESTFVARDIRYGDLLAILPDLFRAGGKSLEQVVTREHLTCHSWANCPMAVAFDTHRGIDDVPLAWRHWASLFVWAFDSGLLGPERIAQACGVEWEATA